MSQQQPDQPASGLGKPGPGRPGMGKPSPENPERTVEDVLWHRVERRRARIRAEIQRNRRGEYKVPTWVLAAILGLLLAGWLYLIVVS